jgi:two-component system, OmpR family, phosphate regulon sensor histidine kinase PhoR
MTTDFISNMTHEFKTPVSTISLACEALSDKDIVKTESMYRTYISVISEENKRLGGLAEKILRTALLEKGQVKLKRESVNIHALIQAVAKKFFLQIEQKGGQIKTDFQAKQICVYADKDHLTNVISNLLDNAIKYTFTTPMIIVKTEDREKAISICVMDNGIGISKSNQKKIFENFYRVSSGNVHDVKGFGLGLTYVKSIIEKHGGSIIVESELNKGSKFTIVLPVEDTTKL